MSGRENWLASWGLPQPVTAMSLIGLLKLPRNIVVSAAFSRCRVPGQDEVIARLGGMADRRLLCVVAFNLPWAVDLMIRSCARHLPDWRLVVLDNSSDRECRRLISEICSKADVAYIGLPRNSEWSPNRSHALALNWAYYNVVRPLRPACFGFLDHDCFPISSAPSLSRVEHQPFYGIRRKHAAVVSSAWYLWAGYMFFNSALIGGMRLDFNHDQVRFLDTGGRNWVNLYRHFDESHMTQAKVGELSVPSRENEISFDVQCIDDAFLHVGGASYRQSGIEAEVYLSAVRAYVESTL